MSTITLTLSEIYDLAYQCLRNNGCNDENAAATARTISAAERDGAISHGLFRLPGYITSLRSGKVNGHELPLGIGLDSAGNPTTDAKKIHQGGVILPFGGYKGSAIATMIELLAAGLVGDYFSYEAAEADNKDGGPARGGELIMALSPKILAGSDWAEHSEDFLTRLETMEGVRLPGKRRFANRLSDAPREVNAALVAQLRELL